MFSALCRRLLPLAFGTGFVFTAASAFSTLGDTASSQACHIAAVFPGRMTGAPAKMLSAEYLRQQFAQMGYQSDVRGFNTRYIYADNNQRKSWHNATDSTVIAAHEGQSRQQIIIMVHLDTYTPQSNKDVENNLDGLTLQGIDDNTMGLDVMLELANRLKDIPTRYGIRFIATSGEEEGRLGAQNLPQCMSETEKKNTLLMINPDDLVVDDKLYFNSGRRTPTSTHKLTRDHALAITHSKGTVAATNPGLNSAHPKGTTCCNDVNVFDGAGIPVLSVGATSRSLGRRDGYQQHQKSRAFPDGTSWHSVQIDNQQYLDHALPGHIERHNREVVRVMLPLVREPAKVEKPSSLKQSASQHRQQGLSPQLIFAILAFFFLLLTASAGALANNQVYTWQYVQSDRHKAALQQSWVLFSTLRILRIQFHPQEDVRLARLPEPASSAERGKQFRAATPQCAIPGDLFVRPHTGTALEQAICAYCPPPFRLALPAYGSTLISSSGEPASVESESPLWVAAEKQKLSVSPQQIDTFIRELEQDPPKNFQVSSGFVRCWVAIPAPGRSLSTLAAVIHYPQAVAGVSWQGQYPLVTLMLKSVKKDEFTAWVRAKMALRAGDAITAVAWFAQAAASFLPSEAWGFQQSGDDIINEEFVTSICRIHAEQAILALNRDDCLQAMWLIYQAKENYQPNVAHIAERALTVSELTTFVDKYVPAPSPSDLNMLKSAGRESANTRLRNLLVRRLIHTGQQQRLWPILR